MGDTQIAAKLAEPFGSYSQIIADNAAELGEKIAIRDDDAEITWAQFGEKVERIAARLLEEGLERGQSVAILGYSSIPYALVFLAAVRAGGV
ncbi:MAG: 4-coumarate--CoA ligase, partial [Citromicrobium sp.]|nr:4-coumarate--CoA ligase [Citromicrobium sp.]